MQALGVSGGGPNIDDFFSVDLWTGDGIVRDIVNDFDLTTEEALVWIKCRTSDRNHGLFDTVREASFRLKSNDTDAHFDATNELTAFNSDGFGIGTDADVNLLNEDFVSWSFKKAPKFFDIIKYTGDGVAGREIPHSLGVQAGLVFVKRLNSVANWAVQHVSRGGTNALFLNQTGAESSGAGLWDDVTMTDSVVTLGDFNLVNANANEYIMYVFAHDDSDDGLIQCGGYTGDGSATGPSINLGWKPQYVMVKAASGFANGSWLLADTERGMSETSGTDQALGANLNLSEAGTGSGFVALDSDGFRLTSSNGSVNAVGAEYIYMAIRAKPPTPPFIDLNTIFSTDLYTGLNGSGNIVTTGLDYTVGSNLRWHKARTGTFNHSLHDSERPINDALFSNLSNAVSEDINAYDGLLSDGLDLGQGSGNVNGNGTDYVVWSFIKASRFFDVIKYTGDGVAGREIPHSLGVQAGLCIVKQLDGAQNWVVQHVDRGGTKYFNLDHVFAESTSILPWNNTSMTDASITLGDWNAVNANGNEYIMYVFAHDPADEGVIQCGQYTGAAPTAKEVELGWKPQYVMIKSATGSENWQIFDGKRTSETLHPNTTDVGQGAAAWCTFTETGFTIGVTLSDVNASGQDYIYMAIREE